MSLYIGLDVGTTHITAMVLDVATGLIVATQSVPNATEITTPEDRACGRSEWDAAAMIQLSWEAVRRVIQEVPEPAAISGIGLSGQMHGMFLLSGDGQPCSPFIGWQDQRGAERLPGSAVSYLERVQELSSHVPHARMATGFMGLTLFWMKENGFSFPPGSRACFISDGVASWLTGEPPCTDPSNADSSGLFEAATRQWNRPLVEQLGLSPDLLLPVRLAPAIMGGLRRSLAQETGLRAGIPVGVSIGDNQASFLGSVADYAGSAALNIGTGGQISAHIPAYLADDILETRCYPDGGYLLVSAGLCGGRSYAILRDFFRAVGQAFFGARGDEDLYERMNELAAAVPPGCDGLRCTPLFTGTRHNPSLRATWSGLSPTNLNPAYMTRSLLEGLARTFAESYERMLQVGVTERAMLIGAGNGLRRNPLLARIAASTFSLPLHIPVHEEEAAFGAALLAAVADGQFPTLEAAGSLIRYLPPVEAECVAAHRLL